MSESQSSSQPTVERITVDVALTNAARLLHHAEAETNLATMERIEKLADSWINMASLLAQRERDAT